MIHKLRNVIEIVIPTEATKKKITFQKLIQRNKFKNDCLAPLAQFPVAENSKHRIPWWCQGVYESKDIFDGG